MTDGLEPRWLAVAAVVLLAAFEPSAAGAQEYYADVRPILTANCVGCHSEAGIAWSMEDPEEAYERRRDHQTLGRERLREGGGSP